MVRTLTQVSVRSVLPVGAAIFFFLGCFSVLSSLVLAAFAPGPITSFTLGGPLDLRFTRVPPAYIFLLYPFLSAIAGALGSAILAWVYNFSARLVGPIRFTLSD